MPVIATDSFNFNPPTRKGWDSCAAGISNALEEFQSTHPQGVGQQKFTKRTLHSMQKQQNCAGFQLASNIFQLPFVN